MEKQYLQFKIDNKTAKKTLCVEDWPEMFEEHPKNLNYQKLLIPFNIYDNSCLCRQYGNQDLQNLTIPKQISRDNFQNNINIDTDIEIIEPELAEYNVFLPFWYVSSSNQKNTTVLIDGFSGKIITGKIQASKVPAYERCFFFTGLFILLSFVSSTFLLEIISTMFGHGEINISNLKNLSNHSFIFTILGLTGLIFITSTLRNYFFSIIKEPLIRAEKKLIYLPLAKKWKDLLQIISIISLGSTLMTIFMLMVLNNVISPQINFTVFIYCLMSFCIFLISAFLSKDRMALLIPDDNNQIPKLQKNSDFSKLVKLTIEVSLYTLAASLTGKLILTSGLSIFTSNRLLNDHHFLMNQCGAIGTYLGVFISEMSSKFKLTVLIVMITEEIGCAFFGEWIGMLFAITAIVISSALEAKDNGKNEIQKNIFKNALYLAWYFLFFQIIGRVILMSIGTFLLGTDGIVLGEMLGEKIGSLIGFMIGWKKITEQ